MSVPAPSTVLAVSSKTRSLKLLALSLGAGVALLAGALGSSCGLTGSASDSYSRTCSIPEDQSGTIDGHWASAPPVPIAFHQGDFTASEITSIIAAANTWNAFFASSKSISSIDYGSATSPRMVNFSKGEQGCDKTLLSTTGEFIAPVILYKNTSWSYPSGAIAVTRTCWTSATPYRKFHLAWIEFNYQHFFNAGQKLPDLESIILHEFGHLLGLDHSCEKNGGTGMPNCDSATLNAEYVEASMYPLFGFDSANNGVIKRLLKNNDQIRMNCLY